jgi:hypothetical protein
MQCAPRNGVKNVFAPPPESPLLTSAEQRRCLERENARGCFGTPFAVFEANTGALWLCRWAAGGTGEDKGGEWAAAKGFVTPIISFSVSFRYSEN